MTQDEKLMALWRADWNMRLWERDGIKDQPLADLCCAQDAAIDALGPPPAESAEPAVDGTLIYEDTLPPDITDAEYAAWFKQSKIVDGVRMGPPLNKTKEPK